MSHRLVKWFLTLKEICLEVEENIKQIFAILCVINKHSIHKLYNKPKNNGQLCHGIKMVTGWE